MGRIARDTSKIFLTFHHSERKDVRRRDRAAHWAHAPHFWSPARRAAPRTVLRGGTIVTDSAMIAGDVALDGELIAEVGLVPPRENDQDVDCRGHYILPGFIDTHSHLDAAIFRTDVQQSVLAQGITTAIGGQDGVSYAPGSGAYGSEYFAAINGPHPHYRGGGIGDILTAYDERIPINMGYLVPAGTVRFDVMGKSAEPADADQCAAMVAAVAAGMDDGALGVSTGLDYVPGIFADAAELAALCAPLRGTGAPYVSHMRGGYESNSAVGIAEMAEISRLARVPIHISHLHAETPLVLQLLAGLEESDVDATFDAYPYTRGATLVAMAIFPAEFVNQPVAEVVRQLTDPAERQRLRAEWFPQIANKPSLGPDWPDMILLGHVPHPDFARFAGSTIRQAAHLAGADIVDFTCDVLAACRLHVNATMAVRHARDMDDLAEIFAQPGHMGGSDGIFIGAHLHPRARGTFPRYLRQFVIQRGTWSWPDAVAHLSTRPAQRFQLGRRGVIAAGYQADVIVINPDTIADQATYEHPEREAAGVRDVWVAGQQVWQGGLLTGAQPGRGLRRSS